MAKTKVQPKTTKAAPKPTRKTGELRAYADVKRAAETLADQFTDRDKDFESYEKLFTLNLNEDLGKTKKSDARTLFDPHGYNAIESAVRMYAANAPSIAVPVDLEAIEQFNEGTATDRSLQRENANQVEEFIKALMYAHSTVSDKDPWIDSLYSANLYGVTNIIPWLPLGELDPARQPTLDELDDIVAPVRFRVPSARLCYGAYSEWGDLVYHLYKSETTIADVREHWGNTANFDITGDDMDPATAWDIEYKDQRCAWIEEQAQVELTNVANVYGFLRRVSRRGASPGFLTDVRYQQMPLLFAYLKAGIAAATNLLLTVNYNNVIDFSNPILVYFLENKALGAPLVDWDKPGSSIALNKDERVDRIYRGLVPPELLDMLGRLGVMAQDSTISRASLGALPNQSMAAAALNLISMSSRIATFLTTRSVELAWEAAFSKMLRVLEKRNQVVAVWGQAKRVVLKPTQIKGNYHVRVKFRPDRELEKSATAGLAAMLFERLGIGYDTAYELLEEGGIGESASRMFEDHLERLFIEAEAPKVAAEQGAAARRFMHVASKIPEAPPMTAGAAQPAPGAPLPVGMQIPDLNNLPGGAPVPGAPGPEGPLPPPGIIPGMP